jgi:hypothetical protein
VRDLNERCNVHNVVPAGGSVSRRRFLELAAGAGATAALVPLLTASRGADAARAAAGQDLPPGYVPSFPDGVIAGDPVPDGTVIWTRLGVPAAPADLPVMWEVATDDTFADIVAGGDATASPTASRSGCPASTQIAGTPTASPPEPSPGRRAAFARRLPLAAHLINCASPGRAASSAMPASTTPIARWPTSPTSTSSCTSATTST